MNEEQEHDAKLWRSSQTGLLAFFMVLLVGMAMLAMVNLWPLPLSASETIEQE
jgi:hypothetical protein